jgi:hypothetical protein
LVDVLRMTDDGLELELLIDRQSMTSPMCQSAASALDSTTGIGWPPLRLTSPLPQPIRR